MPIFMTSIAASSAAQRGETPAPPVSGAELTVAWDDNSSVEVGFRVRTRKTSVGGAYTLADTRPADATQATLTGLDYGTSYDITVASFNEAGEYAVLGPYSRYTPPEFAPTGLSASQAINLTVELDFDAITPTPTGYQSQFRIAGSPIWLDGPTSESAPIVFTGLDSGTDYEFQIRAYFDNPNIDDAPQLPSYSPYSSTCEYTTPVEAVTTDYIDAISALSLPPLAHWPLAANANASLNGEYFDGVASDVTFGQSSIIFQGGKSALFGPTSEITFPDDFAVGFKCALVVWVEFLTIPYGVVKVMEQKGGFGILIDEGAIQGFVNGSGYFGGTTFDVAANTKYCIIVLRKADSTWSLFVNGVEGAYHIGATGTTSASKIGSSTNNSSTLFRLHHASMHYNDTVSPDATWAAAIYAARL